MEHRGKIQNNQYGINVIVETNNSTNRHIGPGKTKELITVLSDEEIIEIWSKRKDKGELKIAKEWIKKQNGYAVSNCIDKSLNVNYGSIVKFK